MRIALIHEFLTQLGGAERVLENFLEIWPDAKVHVLVYDSKKTQGIFDKADKKISFLDKLPFIHKHTRLFLPLMPLATEKFDLSGYDLVISDSSSFAKGVKAKNLHICYCHAPTRYLWTAHDYLDSQPYPKLFKFFGRLFLKRLRKWDLKAASRPNFFIANSVNIQKQIRKYYNRDAVVIPPPVDTQTFRPEGQKQNYFFAASRLEPYKKIELVIEAFNRSGAELKIAGSGTASAKLRKLANSNIEFLGRISDDELRLRYGEAKAFIFPAEEDAGIMPLEAQACGTPVIAYRAGGALETIIEGVTGEFFDQQNSESLLDAIKKFDEKKYDPKRIREHAQAFDKKIFQTKIKQFVQGKYDEYRKGSK
ncbi:MAG TPA: glycosyltransferase [Patescibacteria group bacterium]|jgi:glycosyltransferase involved in cell wall biosynthesis|nr:glycosyltransferase [Patescibacteria group bacterium]